MTKAEAAEFLRISLDTLEKLMRRGLPYVKFERRVLFRKRDIDKWLESKVVLRHPK
ncbi:MAG: helix-turn-helix domain-containing protein [Acidobacteriota bacterium]